MRRGTWSPTPNTTGPFPYTSTLYQRFDEQQFEAYRALGGYTAPRAVAGLQGHLRTCGLVPAGVPEMPTFPAPEPTPPIDSTADVRILHDSPVDGTLPQQLAADIGESAPGGSPRGG
jgi:hypothetical protein